MNTPSPIVVRRPAGRRLAGCVGFGLSVLFGGGIVAGLVFWVAVVGLGKGLGIGDEAALGPSAAAGAIAWVAVGALILRAWRRSTADELRLWPDRIERARGEDVDAFGFDVLREIQVFRDDDDAIKRIVLRTEDGRALDIGKADWPLAEVAERLEGSAVPALTTRLRKLLEQGETIDFREPLWWAWLSGIGGVLLCMVGLLALGLLAYSIVVERKFRHIRGALEVGVASLVGGFALIQKWRVMRKGGLTLTRLGIRSPGDAWADELRFPEVSSVAVTKTGVMIAGGRDGRAFRLSPQGENFPVLVELLRGLVPKEAFAPAADEA